MIEVREAVRILSEAVKPLGAVEIPLEQVSGRVLAEAVVADRDFPSTDRSAMDGFAVRSADLEGSERMLAVAGELRAGAPAAGVEVGSRQAVRIFTGSVMPPGADAVVMVERTIEDFEAGTVTIAGQVLKGAHIRLRGSETRSGDRVLEPGTLIHAAEVAALAAVGKTDVAVYDQPAVKVIATGDELVEPDRRPLDHQLRNSNGAVMLAQLRELELSGSYLGIAPDSRGALEAVVRRGLSADVLLLTGGVSAGKYDLVGRALMEAGMELLFHKVAVKPGKPLLAGCCGSCLVIGLPGNPVSAYAGFAIFVAPALRKMMGARRWMNQEITARLEHRVSCRQQRTTYRLARLEPDHNGFTARIIRSSGSGDVLSMTRANGFVITPAGVGDLEPGTELQALLWRDFHLRV
jgi:molybdopterin molybdotransferase